MLYTLVGCFCVLMLTGYPIPRFDPKDRIVEVVCPMDSTCHFYESPRDSVPLRSLTRTEPYGLFAEPLWVTGAMRDEYGQLFLVCVGAMQVRRQAYRHLLTTEEEAGTTVYRYEVMVEEDSDSTLWLDHDDAVIRIMPWPEFLCGCLITADLTSNAPRAAPDEGASTMGIDPGLAENWAELEAVGWHCNWLAVRPVSPATEDAAFDRAWIRWVEDDSLLVDYSLMY
ncbi:hypothetical protein GF402_01320 [Candidatus Fermentibacteria bacterium]|nr:hypothetical protein [Candidatus Fermentibacteria bacterium]